MSSDERKKAEEAPTQNTRDERPQELDDKDLKDITGGLTTTGGVALNPADTDGCISEL
jgi:hypothetical protein